MWRVECHFLLFLLRIISQSSLIFLFEFSYFSGHRLRTDYSDGDPDIEKPFYILKHTYCAAVLTENGFMDSEVSLSFLESEEGKKAIVALHVEGIIDYIETR